MSNRPAVAALLLVALSIPVLAQTSAPAAPARHPMTIDDLWSIVRPGAIAVSPDGTRVAYQATAWSMADNKGNTDLWWVPLAGGEPDRLTRQPGSDSAPAWSPDGAWIYFLSARDGQPGQVYRLPATGGEAEAVTSLGGGVSAFRLSPDGKALLVAASSFKQCGDEACAAARRKADAALATSGRVYDDLLYRHWNAWRGDARSHILLVDPAGRQQPVDLTPGDVDVPPLALGSSHDFAWAPDGASVALVANRDPVVAISTNNDVEHLTLADGKPGARTTISIAPGSDAGPRYSADGRTLYWMSMPRGGFEADRRFLVARDLAPGAAGPGAVRRLFEEPDLSVSDFALAPNGDIYFTAQDRARHSLFRLPVGALAVAGASGVMATSAKVETVLRGGNVKEFVVAPDGKSVVLALESLSIFPELYRLDLETGQLRPLTRHNEALQRTVELGQVDELWYEGGGKEQVHALVVRPPRSKVGAATKVPVIVLAHGGPQGAWLDEMHARWSQQLFAAMGYVVVAPNFHGSTGYGQPFTDSIRKDWGGKPYQDVMASLDAVAAKVPEADASRVCAAGGSYGGYMVNWLLAQTGQRFRCFVSHAGLYDVRAFYGATEEVWFPEWDFGGPYWVSDEFYDQFSPSSYAAKFKTPTLVIHGELDYRVPVTQAMQLFTALQRQGITSRFLYFPDEAHFIAKPANARLWWETIEAWFATYLADPAPSTATDRGR
jgi:dipeptidyl aminopeptidase/acylaminoacyl peptidase